MPEEATGTGKVRSLGTGGECERQAFSGITRSHPYGLEKSRLVQTSVFRAARQDVHRIYYCGFIFRIIAGVDVGLLSRLYNREKLQSNLARALSRSRSTLSRERFSPMARNRPGAMSAL